MNEILNRTTSTVWKKSYPWFIGLFYFGQGYGFGIFENYMSMYLNEFFGLPIPETSGIIAVIMIPWYLKPIWGIISDRFGSQRFGRRRPYLLASGLAALVGYLLVASITSYGTPFLLVTMFTVLAVAMSDAILDALAVDVTPEEKRGLVQGVAWGARSLGSVLMGAFTAMLVSRLGWGLAFVIGGVLLGLNCLLTLFIQEPPLTEQSVSSLAEYKEAFIGQNARGTWLCIAFSGLSCTPLGLLFLSSVYLRQAFLLSVDDVGICLMVAFVVGAISAFVWGLVVDKLGSKRSTYIILVVSAVILSSSVVIPTGFGPLVIFWLAAVAFAGMSLTVSMMRIGMEFSPPRIAGTAFAIYAAVATLTQALGSTLVGYVSPHTGLRYAVLALLPFYGLSFIPLRYMTLYEPEVADQGGF